MKSKANTGKVIIIERRYALTFFSLLLVFIFSAVCLPQKTEPVSAGVKTEYKVPCIMYHLIVDDSNKEGKYIITPLRLEEDIRLIKSMGFTPITSSDLISFANGEGTLPDKPIILTFDDGYYNNYSYAYPLFKRYRIKGIISVIGKYTDDYSKDNAIMDNSYSYMNYTQIKELHESGVFEIANHTYDMHHIDGRKGVLRKKSESAETYKKNLTQDIEALNSALKEKCGIKPVAFTYPFGSVNKESRQCIENMGFSVTYGCQEGINIITRDKECLKDIKRYNRSSDMNLKEVLLKIL